MDESVMSLGNYSVVSLNQNDLQIAVKDPVYIQEKALLPGHFEFKIEVTKSQERYSIDRRYSDFELYRDSLQCHFPGLFIAPLPSKDYLMPFQKIDSVSIRQRKEGIKNFILQVVSHPTLKAAELTTQFFDIRTAH